MHQKEEADIKVIWKFIPCVTLKLNGQPIPNPTYHAPEATRNDDVEFVDAGDDDESGDMMIPGDVCSLVKKVISGELLTQCSNEPLDSDNDNPEATDDEDAPDWEFDFDEK